MAGVVRKSLLSSAKLISRQLMHGRNACAQRVKLPLTSSCRNLWNMGAINPARAAASSKVLLQNSQLSLSHTCGPCCRLHTEVDKEISKFLEKEIESEESSLKSGLPKITGFEVSAEDASVTLTRKQGTESVRVIFNVNGSADSDQVRPAGEEGSQEVQMISRPAFTVELDKGTGETLSFQCVFSALDEYEQEQEAGAAQDTEPIVDQFDIVEVALHKGKWTETVYTMQSETMDGNLYELLMDMLDERGINDDFINNLVEFSTAYENGKYLGMLKSLKSFVEQN